jgi:hypothetical protein
VCGGIVAGVGGDFLEEIPGTRTSSACFISNGIESASIVEAAEISDQKFQIQGI